MSTTAATWFRTAEEFQNVVKDAILLAKGETSQDFAHDMKVQCDRYGLNMRLSERQCDWLCKLADIIVPLKRTV